MLKNNGNQAVIRFLSFQTKPKTIYEEMLPMSMYGKEFLSDDIVNQWKRKFKCSFTIVQNDLRELPESQL